MNLDECRQKIDLIDTEILSLLNRRAGIAKHIGSLKAQAGLPVVDDEREAQILQKVSRENPGELRDEAAARIYRQILLESRQIQINELVNLSRNGEISK
ncbi:MAG: chorismate mutase [Saprospiraceae bacterium]|nr:chorismate mutase [Pyrinomonadaceae bacterium]